MFYQQPPVQARRYLRWQPDLVVDPGLQKRHPRAAIQLHQESAESDRLQHLRLGAHPLVAGLVDPYLPAHFLQQVGVLDGRAEIRPRRGLDHPHRQPVNLLRPGQFQVAGLGNLLQKFARLGPILFLLRFPFGPLFGSFHLPFADLFFEFFVGLFFLLARQGPAVLRDPPPVLTPVEVDHVQGRSHGFDYRAGVVEGLSPLVLRVGVIPQPSRVHAVAFERAAHDRFSLRHGFLRRAQARAEKQHRGQNAISHSVQCRPPHAATGRGVHLNLLMLSVLHIAAALSA